VDLIVLAKYVPDILKVPDDAWDRERGTLRRHRLKMVFNPLDRIALRMAVRIREAQASRTSSGPLEGGARHSRITVITMGPPVAARLLREAVAHGADQAVLLTDRAFAGSDTLATAYALERAIRRLVAIGKVSADFIVLCGMQSPDGDTAQVPAQVAALLDAPIYPYATEVWLLDALAASALRRKTGTDPNEKTSRGQSPFSGDVRRGLRLNDLAYRCLNPVGFQVVRPRSRPYVVTATRLAEDLPFYVSMEGILRAQSAEVLRLDAAAIGADPSRIGLEGSRTRVVRIYATERKAQKAEPLLAGAADFPQRAAALCRQLRAAFAEQPPTPATVEERFTSPVGESYYTGDCLAVCEADEGGLTPASFEVTSRAAHLARALGARCAAVLPGPADERDVEALRRVGTATLYLLEGERDGAFRVRERALALAAFIAEHRPQIVIVPATLTGRIVAPYVSARLDCGLTADCSALDVADYSAFDHASGSPATYAKVLQQTRPALGGNIMARIVSIYRDRTTHRPQMATARPGALPRIDLPAEKCEVIRMRIAECGKRNEEQDEIALERREEAKTEIDLRDFEAIVCVGMGVRDRATIERVVVPFCRQLAAFLGCEVGLGASRAVVDAGLLPHAHQIGQTGIVVKPRLYVALGVSGAVQHRIGMEGARLVLAVNRDPAAPLHALADFSIIGEIEAVLPVLGAAVRQT
jgi:electron transfer flavoprotein alpha subunit